MSINKIRPLPPFKLQVLTNFPFIDADFEALTNWELYCKLVDYINKVIVKNENDLNDNMNNLIDSFNNLKNYVDEYFENLNIQEEVNIKLDEMALDGTLEALISPVVQSILTDEKLQEIVYNIWGEDWNNLASKDYVNEKVAKVTIMPIASNDYLGKIVQYIGTTNATYTKGYFYECVSDGGSPATYSWIEIIFSETSEIKIDTSNGDLFNTSTTTINDVLTGYITLNATCLNSNKSAIINEYNKMVDNNVYYKEFTLHLIDSYDSSFNVYKNSKLVINRFNYDSFIGICYDYFEFLDYNVSLDTKLENLPQITYQIDRLWLGDNDEHPTYDETGHITYLPDITTNSGSIVTIPNLSINNNYEYPLNNYAPVYKKYVDDNIAKYSTMPTASVDYLGKVVQYIGTTDSTYTKGHFYECISDGGSPATYSWSEISFGSSVNSTDLYYMDYDVIIDYTNHQYSNNDKLIPIINEVRNANKTSFIINVRTNYGSQVRGILVANIIHNTSNDTYTLSIYPRTNNYYNSYKYINNSLLFSSISSNLTLVNDEVTALSNFVEGYSSDLGFLPVNNTEPYNVTNDYNPAHKKYVDEITAKVTTMPTASSTYEGKVYQYIGTTNSTYTKGHFYECINNGGVYSWEEISFGGNASLPIYKINENQYLNLNASPSITKSSNLQYELQNIANDMYSNGYTESIIYIRNNLVGTSGIYPYYCTFGTYMFLQPIITTNSLFFIQPKSTFTTPAYVRNWGYYVSISGGYVTLSGETSSNSEDYYLSAINTFQYTPTGDYNPATKKYVDDFYKSIAGYDGTKIQKLVNSGGTLMWVDET